MYDSWGQINNFGVLEIGVGQVQVGDQEDLAVGLRTHHLEDGVGNPSAVGRIQSYPELILA